MNLKTDYQKARAFEVVWKASFAGMAIVSKDFVFLDVNKQFCKIAGVTEAELIGKKFTDITPEPIKSLDVSNANLVKQGKNTSYIMPKTYEFSNGKRVDITLIARGVFCKKKIAEQGERTEEAFMFFASSIMENLPQSTLPAPAPKQTSLFEWIDKKKIGMGLLAFAVALGYGVIKYFMEN